MKSNFTDVKSIYLTILSIFALNPGDGLSFGAIINKLRYANNEVLAVINADDEQQSPDFTILREGKICLSNDEDKVAFIIEQKGKNEEKETILVYLDNGRVMVSKGNFNVTKKLINKGFNFNYEDVTRIPKYKPDLFLDEESDNNYNKNDVINNVDNHDNNINQFNESQIAEENMHERNRVGSHDNNFYQLNESQNNRSNIFNVEENMNEEIRHQRSQPHLCCDVCGPVLSCLDCCHCFGGQQSV